MSNDKFNIKNFLNDSPSVMYPEWLNINNLNEMAIYEAICNQSSQIEARINSHINLKLEISKRKITAASIVREVGLKHRSSFTEDRYKGLYKFMLEENQRFSQLWDNRVKVISQAISRPNKADVQMKVNELSQKVARLEARVDLKFIGELFEARRKFRFVDLKRTIEEQQKRIDELELQNSELQLRLRDMFRPI